MRAIIATLICCACSCTSALASGGMACEATDKNATLSISAGVTHGMGSPIFNLTGSLATHLEGIGEDMRNLTYDGDEIAQWWTDGQQLNLVLYVERVDEPFGSTQLTIATRSVAEGAYEGEYVIVSYDDGVRAEVGGPVACMSE